jgi:hypothetical protein
VGAVIAVVLGIVAVCIALWFVATGMNFITKSVGFIGLLAIMAVGRALFNAVGLK